MASPAQLTAQTLTIFLDEIHDTRATNLERFLENLSQSLELPGKQLEAQLAAAPSPAEAPIIPAAQNGAMGPVKAAHAVTAKTPVMVPEMAPFLASPAQLI